MKHTTFHNVLRGSAALAITTLGLTACGEDNLQTPAPVENVQEQEQDLRCSAQNVEEDAVIDPRLGEAGDPANWPALPPNAVVATTYLRLENTEAGMGSFEALMQPILGVLTAPAPGLMGLSFMSSQSCGTTRTLSVWESEEAMMNFVLGEAHLAAMGRVTEVSRGGSATLSRNASEYSEVNWENVLAGFASHNGPTY